jgi:O-antigen/teichoic acid export membrane protein
VPAASDSDLLGTTAAGGAAIRGGAVRVVGYGVGVLLAVASSAVLFRHLGVQDAGSYVLVLSVVTLFGTVTDAGLAGIGVRELAAHGGFDRDHLLRSLLGLRLLLTGIGVLLACGFTLVVGYDRVLVLGTAIAGVGLILTTQQNALATVLVVELRLGWVTIADGLRQLVTAIGIVVLVVLGAELLPFFAVTGVAALAALLLTLWLVRDVPRRPSIVPEIWTRLIRDTIPFALATVVGAVYFRLGILLVEGFSGPQQTGYFGASFRVVEVLVVVPQLALGAVFPILSRAASNDLDRLTYAVQKSFDASVLLGAFVAIALGLGAPFAIEVVAGPDFAPAADVLRLHAVALLASFAAAVFGYTLLSLRRHAAVLAMNAGALGAMAIAGTLLTRSNGAEGAAAATILSELVLGVVGAIMLRRTGALSAPLSLRVIPRLAVAGAVAVAIPVALSLPALPAAVIGTAVFGALALALRAVPDEVLVEARRLLSRQA